MLRSTLSTLPKVRHHFIRRRLDVTFTTKFKQGGDIPCGKMLAVLADHQIDVVLDTAGERAHHGDGVVLSNGVESLFEGREQPGHLFHPESLEHRVALGQRCFKSS